MNETNDANSTATDRGPLMLHGDSLLGLTRKHYKLDMGEALTYVDAAIAEIEEELRGLKLQRQVARYEHKRNPTDEASSIREYMNKRLAGIRDAADAASGALGATMRADDQRPAFAVRWLKRVQEASHDR